MVLELARSDVKSDCKDPIRKILLRSKRQSRTALDSRAGGLISTSQKEAERSKQRPIRSPKNASWSCHHVNAATDHVFTQFYPVLRAVAPK